MNPTVITEKDVKIAIWTELCEPDCVHYQVTCQQNRSLKAGVYSWTHPVPANEVIDNLCKAMKKIVEGYLEDINSGAYSELDNTTL